MKLSCTCVGSLEVIISPIIFFSLSIELLIIVPVSSTESISASVSKILYV